MSARIYAAQQKPDGCSNFAVIDAPQSAIRRVTACFYRK